MPERFQEDMHCTTTGLAKSTLLVEPYWKTVAQRLSNWDGVRAAPAQSTLLVCKNSYRPPAVPCGSVLPFGATDAATKERVPQKPIASHFFLCTRAWRTASLAGSRPP